MMAFNFTDIGGAFLVRKGRQVVWLILALWLLVPAGAATITAPSRSASLTLRCIDAHRFAKRW